MAYLIVRYSQKTGNPVSENSLLFGTGTINSPVTVVRSARKQPLRRIPGILSVARMPSFTGKPFRVWTL